MLASTISNSWFGKREKLIKKWKRVYKINLIESRNPEWNDLAADWDFTGYVTSKERFE